MTLNSTQWESTRVFLVHFVLISVSALLYAFAFPNPLIERGFAPAAWVCYVGVFVVTARTRLCFVPLWGAFFGALSITLHNYWLTLFHPLAGLIAGILFAFYYAAFFFVLKLVLFLPRPVPATLVQSCLWVGFEYLRTLGFVGYSYGITGYSQWTLPAFIKIASLAGVWAVSALIIFPQACAGLQMVHFLKQDGEQGRTRRIYTAFKQISPAIAVWAALLLSALFYGVFSKIDYTGAQTIQIALLQPASNPWKSDIAEFRKELAVLMRLSDRVLTENPPPDLVVWPETAFVPSFYYHGRYRVDVDSTNLVREAEQYLASKNTPFIIGNNEGRRVPSGEGRERLAQYNAALLFDRGEVLGRYYKMHLVPFTEYFPYEQQFPVFYEFLLAADTHFWEKGTDPVLFNMAEITFCTPICFEDTFGADVRQFVRQGAQLIVNLTNDSWSHSLSAQYQHLSTAVFRAVETGRAVVRSTATGQTCAIDPNGNIIAMSKPWIETTLSAAVPILNGQTLYTRLGDWLPATLLLFAALTSTFCVTLKFLGTVSKGRRKGEKVVR